MSDEIKAANLNSYQAEKRPKHARRLARISTGPSHFYNPTHRIAGVIENVLDPAQVLGQPCRTLADMSEEEIVALEVEYTAKLKRPVTVKRPAPTEAPCSACGKPWHNPVRGSTATVCFACDPYATGP